MTKTRLLANNDLDTFLQQWQSAGHTDSVGVFTLSAEKAAEKLSQFSLVEPHFYVLNVLSSAVLGQASHFDAHIESTRCLFSFDGEPFSENHLKTLLSQLLSRESERLYEMAVALNALRGRDGTKFELLSGGWALRWDGSQFQVGPSEPDVTKAENRLLVYEQAWISRLVGGLWKTYPEASTLTTLGAYAPLILSLNKVARRRPLEVGTTSSTLLGWVSLGSEPDPVPTPRPDLDWSTHAVVFDSNEHSTEGYGAVMALDTQKVPSGQSWKFLCNGVAFERELGDENFVGPFVYGIAWGPLDKNASHSDLAENDKYQQFVGWLRRQADHLTLRRLESPQPLPEQALNQLMKWAPRLRLRFQERDERDEARRVEVWESEMQFLLDLKDEVKWSRLLQSMNAFGSGAPVEARTVKLRSALKNALYISLQAGNYLDCEPLARKLQQIEPENREHIEALLVTIRAICGMETGPLDRLNPTLKANILRLSGKSSSALKLLTDHQMLGEVHLAEKNFPSAETELRRAVSNSVEALDSLADCLLLNSANSSAKKLEGLELKKSVMNKRAGESIKWGGFLQHDLARMARGLVPFHQWVKYQTAASWAGVIPSPVAHKVEVDLESATALAGKAPAGIGVQSALLYAERAFPLNHIFLKAARSKGVYLLRRAGLWDEADPIIARGHLLDYLLAHLE